MAQVAMILCVSCVVGIIAHPEVTLNSTLIRGNSAFPAQMVVFTCQMRNYTLLEWRSDEYIGIGNTIPIYSSGSRDNLTSGDTYATRVSVTVEDGVTVIVSQLHITASELFPISSVTCSVDGNGSRKTITFNITNEEPPSPELNSTLHERVSTHPETEVVSSTTTATNETVSGSQDNQPDKLKNIIIGVSICGFLIIISVIILCTARIIYSKRRKLGGNVSTEPHEEGTDIEMNIQID